MLLSTLFVLYGWKKEVLTGTKITRIFITIRQITISDGMIDWYFILITR